MTDDVRARLIRHAARYGGTYVVDDILADPSLLVVAKPKCDCGTGIVHLPTNNPTDENRTYPVLCPDCGGTSYRPMTALPTKRYEALLVAADAVVDTPLPRQVARLADAVRLAQETAP